MHLERLFKEFRDLGFPGSRGFTETDLLHTLLIQYDADVRGDIMKVLDAPKPSKDLLRLSGLQEDEKIQSEIARLVSGYPNDSEIGRVARKYSDYYGFIKKLVRAAHSYLDTSNH